MLDRDASGHCIVWTVDAEIEAKIKRCCATYLPADGQQRFPLSTIAGWLIPDSHLHPDIAKMLDFMHIGVTTEEWRERILYFQHEIHRLGYEPLVCRESWVAIRKKIGVAPDGHMQMVLGQASDRLQDELAKLRP